MKPQRFKILLAAIVVSFGSVFVLAQVGRDRGIELFKQGKDWEAIIAFNTALKTNKKDSELLNYLGLANLNLDNYKDARKAFQKAVNLNPQNSTYLTNLAHVYLLTRKVNRSQRELTKAIQLDPNNSNAYYIRGKSFLWERKYDIAISDADSAIKLKKTFADAYILKSDGLMYSFGKQWNETNESAKALYLLRNAADVLNSCVGDCLVATNSEFLKERLETVKAFLDFFDRIGKSSKRISDSELEEITPIKFLSKPEPKYTDKARQNDEQGIVSLAILFGADGEIKFIMVLEGLNYGLTEQAIEAAKKITFEPAARDGKPVVTVKRVQYRFSIY